MFVQFSSLEFVNVGAIFNGFLLEEIIGISLAAKGVPKKAKPSGDFMALESFGEVFWSDGSGAIGVG